MKLNNANCGSSRPLTVPESVVLVVIIIVAGALAAAGWSAVGAALLVLESLSLGRRLLVRLRRGRTVTAQPAQG